MISQTHITKPRYALGFLAVMAGCLVNYVGDRILGIRIELFYGLSTFNFIWFLQLFMLPVLVGIVVSLIFGRGGKWLAHFPPFIVRLIAYYETQYLTGVPENTSLMPMGWWGFFVILAVECGMIGGIIGEVMNKRTYGRSAAPVLESDLGGESVEEEVRSASNGD